MGGIKRIGVWLRDRVRRDRESVQLLLIYLTIIILILALNN